MIVVRDIKLSRDFSLSEFACRDERRSVYVVAELVERLQVLRDHFKRPVVITSGYRSKTYNRKVGGADGSQHIEGRAADIKVIGVGMEEIARAAIKAGFRGIGIYGNFVHVDVRRNLVNRGGRPYDIWRER